MQFMENERAREGNAGEQEQQVCVMETGVYTDCGVCGSAAHSTSSDLAQLRQKGDEHQERDQRQGALVVKLERLEDILLRECEDLSTDLDDSSGDSLYITAQCAQQAAGDIDSRTCDGGIRQPPTDQTFEKSALGFLSVAGLDENTQAAFLFLRYSPYAMAAISAQHTGLSGLFTHYNMLKRKAKFLNKACKSMQGAEEVLRFIVTQLEIDQFRPNPVVPRADSLERFVADEKARQNAFLSQVLRTVERVEKTCKCGVKTTYSSLESLEIVFTARALPTRLADQLARLAQHAEICDVCFDAARIRTRVLRPARQLLIFLFFANRFTRSPITADSRLEKKACGNLFAECPDNFEYRLNTVMRKAHGGYVSFHVSDGVEEYQALDGKLMQRRFRPTDPWIVALCYERVDL